MKGNRKINENPGAPEADQKTIEFWAKEQQVQDVAEQKMIDEFKRKDEADQKGFERAIKESETQEEADRKRLVKKWQEMKFQQRFEAAEKSDEYDLIIINSSKEIAQRQKAAEAIIYEALSSIIGVPSMLNRLVELDELQKKAEKNLVASMSPKKEPTIKEEPSKEKEIDPILKEFFKLNRQQRESNELLSVLCDKKTIEIEDGKRNEKWNRIQAVVSIVVAIGGVAAGFIIAWAK